MEAQNAEQPEKNEQKPNAPNPKKNKFYVYPIRDWKEYLGESLLIVFSVLLALIVTEHFNNLHEKQKTLSMIKNIVSEFKHDRQYLTEMQKYNHQVLNPIDSALVNKSFQNKIITNGKFNLGLLAPSGVLYRYLENEAWIVAKNNNIMSKINLESVLVLSRVYDDMDRINKIEDEVAGIIFDRASRDSGQINTTLILISDNYHTWVVDRTAGLLISIDEAIQTLSKNVLD